MSKEPRSPIKERKTSPLLELVSEKSTPVKEVEETESELKESEDQKPQTADMEPATERHTMKSRKNI